MNDKILDPVRCGIDLNKVVATPQRAETSGKAFGVLQFAVAAQLRQVKLFLSALPNILAGRDKMRSFVQLFHVDFFFSQAHGIHAAAYIDANHIGDGLIQNRHSCSDGAACTGMNIRHNADSTAFGQRIVAHPANLFDSSFFNDFGIAMI